MFKWIGDILKKVIANLLTIAALGVLVYFFVKAFVYG